MKQSTDGPKTNVSFKTRKMCGVDFEDFWCPDDSWFFHTKIIFICIGAGLSPSWVIVENFKLIKPALTFSSVPEVVQQAWMQNEK
jgi:hypothetical protein